jgi:hypothetical protein
MPDNPDDLIIDGVNISSLERKIDLYMGSWPSIEGVDLCNETRNVIRVLRDKANKPEEPPDDSAFRA